MELSFKDKIVVVTGAGRGIGRSIAERFAELDATVILSDYNEESLKDVAADFDKKHFSFKAIPCDVTNADQVNLMLKEAIDSYGKIDVLINNAGITRDTLLIRMKDEQWNAVLDTNLKGVFFTTRAAAKYFMKQRYGRIINISSVVGITGNAGQGNYSASKAGVIGFSKSMAQELAGRNITVNVIAPGFIETEMTNVLSESVKDDFIDKIPLKRAGTPKDVANTALFLASHLADYLTGQVIKVDGGMVM
ncbi:MAG: 3-oxoacyl-[acyl-carrier-protein] reductase [Candidatus Marinimicrobia bacterium]|nr:3-oxoacyl-[acyl-carrier-protein] reductase [Candidatus Neomarinimicrobiota bacterium]